MKQLYTEIEINAPAEQVWQILTDFDGFPDWNPFIRQAAGTIEPGQPLEIELSGPGGRTTKIKPNVVTAEPNREFSWLGHTGMRGLFDGKHIFIIEALDENRVRFIQREEFNGILVSLVLSMIGRSTEQSFADMNQALKEKAEQ